MPAGHRFPIGKFGRLMTYLLEQRLVAAEQVHVPELAPPGWLALAHSPEYVHAVLSQSLDQAAARRIGLPITLEIATRSRAANARATWSPASSRVSGSIESMRTARRLPPRR